MEIHNNQHIKELSNSIEVGAAAFIAGVTAGATAFVANVASAVLRNMQQSEAETSSNNENSWTLIAAGSGLAAASLICLSINYFKKSNPSVNDRMPLRHASAEATREPAANEVDRIEALREKNNAQHIPVDEFRELVEFLRLNADQSIVDSIANGSLLRAKHLNLSNKSLEALPKSIENLASLETLNVSNNKLTALPESIGNLGNLQQLYVSRNKLTALPDAIGNLASLQWLDVSNNQITALPDAIGNLASLQSLKR